MARTVYARQGDTVDALCKRHYGATTTVVERVYATNRGLAELGPILPRGTSVVLPDVATKTTTAKSIKLWD